ncbi:MAG: PDDEXK nuclease domain-containing protein [Bacteroidales bacterium]|nr:PDDEXK nuclease domain-containing protein [Bacteroidales bacterium]
MNKIDKPTNEARVTAVYDNAAVGIHSCIEDIRQIIDSGRKAAYLSVNAVMVQTYWNIGRRIVEEEQNGKERADYGEFLITTLADSLTHTFGNTFSKRNLQYFRKFYQLFPDFEIVNTRVHNLTWSHYRRLLTVHESDARYWYLNEANEQMWSVRTLDRNVSTQYYHRLMQSPKKEKVIAEMQQKTADFQKNKYELIKSPVVAEFLGFSSTDYSETDLEKAIITHLRDFLMELGRGFAFVARQQHIVTETDDYFIDLVFYNIELKCYVLIDLKIGKITHQDVGQMDMYVRMYDDLKRKNDDNPTIGIVLCSETDKDIARYSILHDSNQIFMAKYMPYLPSEDELRAEIETQKQMFYLQQKERQ